MWYSHTMEYYLTIKRNEVLIYAWTWMNNMDEPQKHTKWKKPETKCLYYKILFLWNIQKKQIYIEIRLVVSWGWDENKEWLKMGLQELLGETEMF